MRKNIRIENPVSGCGFTSKNRAKRFVAQGRAEWVQAEVSIRFVPSDHRHISVQKSAELTRYWYERAVNTGMAQLADLVHLPVIAPAVALGMGRRKGATETHVLGDAGV
jgi:hypothetical protein